MSNDNETSGSRDVPTTRRGRRRTRRDAERLATRPDPAIEVASSAPIARGTGKTTKWRPSSRYRSFAVIGRGGMGEVRVAHDRRIGRTVAVKVLRDEMGERSESARRFVREARVQGQLEHPAIVPVYDLGTDPDGRPYFAMKRVSGVTLADVVRDLRSGESDVESRYSTRKLLSIFQSVCLALEYAHSRGVVHRDVKPSNLMLGDFGEVYVLDWGVAKVRGHLAAEVGSSTEKARRDVDGTRHDEILGSLGYMAPEQIAHARTVDARADVYSLGAVLFELLAREPLHRRGSENELLASTVAGTVDARPSARAPERDIPPELDAICVRATALEPGDRFQSAREMHDAIEAFLEGDRDVRLRSELAREHVEVARRALDTMRASGDADASARKRALREAGKALTLDPKCEPAAAIVARLMLEPPSVMPAEVKDVSERVRTAEKRNAVRLSALGLAVTVPFALAAPFLSTIRSWPAYTMMVLALIATAIHAHFVSRSSTADYSRHSVIMATEFAFVVAGFTRVLGPFLLAPTVAFGAAALVAISHWLGSSRAWIILTLSLGWIVPALLDSLGVLPSPYSFPNGTVTVHPDIVEIPEPAFRLGMFAVNLAAVLVVSVVLWRYSQFVASNRWDQDLHTWHLENIAAHDESPLRSLAAPLVTRRGSAHPLA